MKTAQQKGVRQRRTQKKRKRVPFRTARAHGRTLCPRLERRLGCARCPSWPHWTMSWTRRAFPGRRLPPPWPAPTNCGCGSPVTVAGRRQLRRNPTTTPSFHRPHVHSTRQTTAHTLPYTTVPPLTVQTAVQRHGPTPRRRLFPGRQRRPACGGAVRRGVHVGVVSSCGRTARQGNGRQADCRAVRRVCTRHAEGKGRETTGETGGG